MAVLAKAAQVHLTEMAAQELVKLVPRMAAVNLAVLMVPAAMAKAQAVHQVQALQAQIKMV